MTNDSKRQDAPEQGQPGREVFDLVWDLCEGAISDVDAAHLDQLLQADAANRKEYVQFMQLVAGLQWEHSEVCPPTLRNMSESPIEEPWLRRPSLSKTGLNKTLMSGVRRSSHGSGNKIWAPVRSIFNHPVPTALCASLATLIAVFLFQFVGRTAFNSTGTSLAGRSPRSQSSSEPIAYLLSAAGNRWGEDSPRLQAVGSPVSAGEAMTLQEGIAEFRLSSGAQLSLEGPAGLVITSPNSVVLQHGKLTAYIPDSGTEFKVMAGANRLTTSSGAFGVDLGGGEMELHVFTGEVAALNTSFMEGAKNFVDQDQFNDDIVTSPDQVGLLEQVSVLRGRSLKLKDNRESVYVSGWGAADDARFSTRLPLSEPLPITRAYINAVKASAPAAYWRFESIDGNIAQNEVRLGDELRVVGKVKVIGNSDNRVIELGGAESDGFLSALDTTNDLSNANYSVEVWLRPNHVHAGAAVAFVGESRDTHDERPGFYLGLHGFGNMHSFSSAHPSVIRFLNRTPPSGDATTGANCFSGRVYQVRRWQHVVAVKQGVETRLYLDGVLVATAQGAESLPAGLRLIIGEASTTQRTYRFCGQLDELSVYRHALSDAEVRKHFSAVRLPKDESAATKKEAI